MQINNINYKNYNIYQYQTSPINFGQEQEPQIFYDPAYKKRIKNIVFPKPTSLKDASDYLLKLQSQYKLIFFNFDKRHLENLTTSKLANVKVKELLGYGTKACAFLTENDKVLKISRGNHLRRKLENFDVPIYDQGLLLLDNPDNIYYYMEEYADPTKVTKNEALDLIEKIKAKGHNIYDIYTYDTNTNKTVLFMEQFGKTSDGRVYLLDPECVS